MEGESKVLTHLFRAAEEAQPPVETEMTAEVKVLTHLLQAAAEAETPKKATRKSFSHEFKKEVVTFANQKNVYAAAKQYGVDRACIRKWRKSFESIENEIFFGNSNRKRFVGGGRPLKNAGIDDKLIQWILEQENSNGIQVTRRMIKQQALEYSTDPSFCASDGWLEAFIRRHNLSRRRQTPEWESRPKMFGETLADVLLPPALKNNMVIKEETQDEEENESTSSPSRKSLKYEEALKCNMCSTVCSSISQLQEHTLNEHVPDKKHSTVSPKTTPPTQQRVCCQQCDETFENFQQFAIHMKSHISSVHQVFHCPVCPVSVVFPDKKSQLEHLTTQHIQMHLTQFMCNECNAVLSTALAMANHFTEAHRKFMCTSCDFVTDNDKAFKEHSRIHSRQVVMFGCSLCGTAYSSQGSLINHVTMTHDQDNVYPPAQFIPKNSNHRAPSPKPQKQRPLQCSVCDVTVFGEDGLDEHRLRKHCKIRYADKCADCHEPILSQESFVSHCLRHARDHAHHCPVCRQSLRSDSQIHAHCNYHMQKPEDLESVSDNIKKEEEEEETDEYDFVCPICGERLENGFELMEHSKQKHE